MELLESSFVTNSGAHANPGDILFANPGEAFQASDNIVNPDLPFRRLEFAGVSDSKCFIHYQYGGQPSSFCLAVVDLANRKTLLVGESFEGAKSLDGLKKMVFQRQFNMITWPKFSGR
jgi:hypothetical protein